jgi:putative ABC transport system substrate-binding protein
MVAPAAERGRWADIGMSKTRADPDGPLRSHWIAPLRQMARGLVNACLVSAFVLAFLTASRAESQQAGKTYRIGIVTSTGHFTHAFLEGLRELGYVEGRNIVIEQRSTRGQSARFPELVAEMIGLKVDVLVVSGIFGALAARKATTTVPVVFLGVADPVGQGVVVSLARPGGNITGTSLALGEGFAAKWVELLKEAVPKAMHVAVLLNSSNSAAATHTKEVQAAARAVGVRTDILDVRNRAALDSALAAIAAGGAQGLIVTSDQLFFAHRSTLVQFAANRRLPAMYFFKDFVDEGGLMAYGASLGDSFRRGATYVDRILKGAKPADLPVEQPIKFELVINLKTAKALNLTIPQSVLLRADRVIE